MTETQTALYLLKGLIAELAPKEQEKIRDGANRIKAIAAELDDVGAITVGLAQLEVAVEMGE